VARTALYERLTAAGARLEDRDGIETAADFGDPAAEATAARQAVAIADRGARSFTLVEGRDATRFLHGVVSNDVEGLAVGDAAYALLLTPKARVVADFRLTRLAGESFLIDAEPAAAESLRTGLARYRMAARATIEPADETYGAIGVLGPAAAALIREISGVTPDASAREGHGAALADDVHALVAALQPGPAFDLVGPRAALPGLWDALAAALPAHGGRPAGATALEILRVEAGVPRFGAELTGEVMPAEAGVVGRAVSFTKGCYIGQEPVARLHYRGHANRGLRGIVMNGAPPAPGTPVAVEGREVGRVTSAAASPALGRTIALAIVRREVEPGRRVAVDGAEGELVELPAWPQSA
jgi:folate-binding protein YgfZ